MLVLRRRVGEWVELTHRSGDIIRIKVAAVRTGPRIDVNLAFDDDRHDFTIQRPERRREHARGDLDVVG